MTARSSPHSLPADGVLVIDKPSGPTSHDVVAVARRVLGVSRIGHTGTLDPMATGVLPLVVGRATRLAPLLTAGRKAYVATIAFGRDTDTYDALGTIVAASAARPDRAALEAALAGMRGTFAQAPPAFSAKSIDGVRAYERARRGPAAAIRPAAVTVTVDQLEVIDFDGDSVVLRLSVTAGFYVRSLAHDLGVALGTGAVLEALRRTRSGDFALEQAWPLADLVTSGRAAAETRLIPFDALLPGLPAVVLRDNGVSRVRHGQEVGPADVESPLTEAGGPIRLLDAHGRLVALGQPGSRPGVLRAPVVFG